MVNKSDEMIEKRVHHYLRYIAKGMPLEGSVLAEQVNMELSGWYAKGYKLFSTHFLGENPEGYGVLYILVREG